MCVRVCVCALGSSCLLDLTAINLAIDVAEGSKHKFDSLSCKLLLMLLLPLPLPSPLLPVLFPLQFLLLFPFLLLLLYPLLIHSLCAH